MSPDSPEPSRTRKAWRFMSALGCVLGATAILTSVVMFTVIQDERARNVRANCEDVNDRHDDTIRKLDELVASRTGAEYERAVRNRASTVALLDAIVPRRDCTALVHQQVNRP